MEKFYINKGEYTLRLVENDVILSNGVQEIVFDIDDIASLKAALNELDVLHRNIDNVY